MDKHRVQHHFAAAAHSYDAHASVQRQAAQHLAQRIAARWPDARRVFEIGCGTGNLTEQLLLACPHAEVLATDLASDMLRVCAERLASPAGPRLRWAQLDGENAHVGGHELVASSLAIQWFNDPLGALRRLHAQGVHLAIATLIDGTFAEWRQAHAQLGLADGVQPFVSQAALAALAHELSAASPATGGASLTIDTLQAHHAQAIDFVRALKGIGAHTPRSGHQPAPLGRVLRQFPHGITISYRVAYLLIDAPTQPR